MEGKEEEVKLLMTTLSPFATRIVWALQLKGVEFEAIEEDLDNKSSSLLRYNPIHKKIPVLVHNGEPVVESLVILEYIDSVWNQTCPLLPADPYQRALARFWAKFVDGKAAMKLRDKEGEEAAVEEARGNLKFMEKELESSGGFNNKFFGGDNVGMVDLAFGSVVFLVDVVEQLRDQLHDQKLINEVNFPLLAQWKDRLSGIDVIRNSLPPADQVAAVLQARQAAN
ncbi:Probable glutathione S-transferase [Linum grandiflorum]